MDKISALIIDIQTMRIVRCTMIDSLYVPPEISGYIVKYHVFFKNFLNEKENFEYIKWFEKNCFQHSWDLIKGIYYNPISIDEKIENDLLLLNKKFKCIEKLWSSMNSFLMSCLSEYYHCNMQYELLTYEFKNNLDYKTDSLSSFLKKEKNIDDDVFNSLARLKENYIYNKKKDIYKSLFEIQKEIFISDSPEETLDKELRKIYYLK
jgi:hypothetical protein